MDLVKEYSKMFSMPSPVSESIFSTPSFTMSDGAEIYIIDNPSAMEKQLVVNRDMIFSKVNSYGMDLTDHRRIAQSLIITQEEFLDRYDNSICKLYMMELKESLDQHMQSVIEQMGKKGWLLKT